MIKVAFYKARSTFLDRLIQWGSGGPYSHVEVILPSGVAIGSSARDGGVRAKEIDFDPENWDFVDVPWADVENVDRFLCGQLGKLYDYQTVFFSHVLSAPWQSEGRWFCSELAAAALGLSNPHRLSPTTLAGVLRDMNWVMGDGE